MSNKPHDTPTKATAEQGEVLLDGPDGLAMSFTPHAAAKSAAALAREGGDQSGASGERRPSSQIGQRAKSSFIHINPMPGTIAGRIFTTPSRSILTTARA
jgi:hypothetical protein